MPGCLASYLDFSKAMLLQTKPSKIGVAFFSTRFDNGFDVYDSCQEPDGAGAMIVTVALRRVMKVER